MDGRVRVGGGLLSRPAWTITVVRPEGDTAVPDTRGDDRELVRACLDGRRDAFDIIVERHRKSVYQVCYRFLGSHEDASDAAQDVLLRAFRALRSFKGDSSLGTWLYRIAVNLCLNRVSTKGPVFESMDGVEAADERGESAADRVIRDERAARVRAAVMRLPPRQRAAVILRVYHDLPYREIAEILDSSVGAVKTNVFHALVNLRGMFGKEP